LVLRQALLIARKDLRIFVADRGALTFAIIFPLVITFGFSSFFGSMTATPDYLVGITMATYEGPDSISQAIIDAIASSEQFQVTQASAGDAFAAVQEGGLDGFLAFPAGFTGEVTSGRPARIQVHLGPESSLTRGALDSIARSIAEQINGYAVTRRAAMDLAMRVGGEAAAGRLVALLARSDLSPPSDETGPVTGTGGAGDAGDAGGASGGVSPVEITEIQVGPLTNRTPANVILPGYVTMFVFFALAMSAEALIGERENSTLDRLVASRATRKSILLGKYLGNVARGTVQAAILWTGGILFMGVDPGYTPWLTFAVTLVLVLAAAGLGLALATVAKTRNSAGAIAVFASLTMAPLGGCWWPFFMMPPWMQTLAKVTPHAWANSAFTKLLYMAAAPSAVVPEIAALLGFAIAFGWLAVARFRLEA